MTLIPKEQIDEQNRKLYAFSNAAEAVVDAIFDIRGTAGHENFRGLAIEIGALEDSALKTALLNALTACQLRAMQLGLDFSSWQMYKLPILVQERIDSEDPEEN